MRENRALRQRLANVRLDALAEIMPALHAPVARHEDVQRDEATGAGLACAQRVELDALLLIGRQRARDERLICGAGGCINPRFDDAKLPIFGNTVARFASGKPYQRASVAAYCSTDVAGTQRPRAPLPLSESSPVLNPK